MTIKLVLLGRQLQTNHKLLQVDQTGPFTQKLQKRVFCDVAGNIAFQDIQFPHARLQLNFCKIFNPK